MPGVPDQKKIDASVCIIGKKRTVRKNFGGKYKLVPATFQNPSSNSSTIFVDSLKCQNHLYGPWLDPH
jgi:hypothetical protein